MVATFHQYASNRGKAPEFSKCLKVAWASPSGRLRLLIESANSSVVSIAQDRSYDDMRNRDAVRNLSSQARPGMGLMPSI
jgi:hypothetical protein